MNKPAEFEAFLVAYQQRVFNTAFHLLANASDAEDITQEVFLRLWTNYPNRVALITVGGWLKSVTRNLCLNHLHRYRARWKTFTDFTSDDEKAEGHSVELACPNTLEPSLLASDQRQLIEQALTALPADQRAALVLYHFEDMDYLEIASRLGVSLGKVKTDISRGRKALRAKLQSTRESC